MRRVPECNRKQCNEIEAERHHDAEAPEQRPDVGNSVAGGARNGCGICSTRVHDIALQQEGVSQVCRVLAKLLPRLGVAAVLPDFLKRPIGDQAVPDSLFGVRDQVVDSR